MCDFCDDPSNFNIFRIASFSNYCPVCGQRIKLYAHEPVQDFDVETIACCYRKHKISEELRIRQTSLSDFRVTAGLSRYYDQTLVKALNEYDNPDYDKLRKSILRDRKDGCYHLSGDFDNLGSYYDHYIHEIRYDVLQENLMSIGLYPEKQIEFKRLS